MSMDLPPGPPPSPSSGPAAPRPAQAAPPTAEDRSTAFRPVANAPEMQSGEKLLVEAYAAIWIVLFVMVLLSWRRQRQLEARIATLDGAVAAARESSARESAAGKGGA